MILRLVPAVVKSKLYGTHVKTARSVSFSSEVTWLESCCPLTTGGHRKGLKGVLRTNLKYANRKILISLFLCCVSIFTLSHIYNAQMTYVRSIIMLFN